MRSHDHHKHDQHSEYYHPPTYIFPKNEHYECSVYVPTYICIPVTICYAMNDNDMHSYQK